MEGSAKCKPIVLGTKIKLWEKEKFDFILEESNLTIYDEKVPHPAERRTERNVMREEGDKTPL